MALTYQANAKTWNYTPEKTDYSSSLEYKKFINVQVPVYWYQSNKFGTWNRGTLSVSIPEDTKDSATFASIIANDVKKAGANIYQDESSDPIGDAWYGFQSAQGVNNTAKKAYEENTLLNKKNEAKNSFHQKVKDVYTAPGYNYLTAKESIQGEKPKLIQAGFTNAEAQKIIDDMVGPTGQYRNYYVDQKITPWDPSVQTANLSSSLKARVNLGGNFNKYLNGKDGYYENETAQGKAAASKWNEAVAKDDLDTIARYGTKNAYLYQDYVNQLTNATASGTSIASIRASEPTPLADWVTNYKEPVFPDATKQQTRDQVQRQIFGLEPAPAAAGSAYQFKDVNANLSNFVATNQTAKSLWDQAKGEAALAKVTPNATPGPWTKLVKSLQGNNELLTSQDSFATLLGRLGSFKDTDAIVQQNPEIFKQINQLKKDNTFKGILDYYAPEISDAFTASISQSEEQKTKQFGQLRQQVLQDTIAALQQAKRDEAKLSLLRSSSLGQEITSLQQEFTNNIIGDLNVGGLIPGDKTAQSLKTKLDLGLGDVFGTKNGLIYNWEQWFNNELEKKYAGDLDIPNDYVPKSLRTLNNGFVDDKTASDWKKYDNAYAQLKINPNDPTAKAIVASVPTNYIAVENRKTVKPEWDVYEGELKKRGYVDPETVAKWSDYDNAYETLRKDPSNTAAAAAYAKRPADYIPPDQRMNQDAQFAKDFFSYYLKPRFDASQSISEFQDYIDVKDNTQNPFQTQDRINALKLAAESSVSKWFTDLQKAGDSRFNSDYYFDPVGYLKANGVGDPTNPLLPPGAFDKYADTEAGKAAAQQSARVNADWEAAKAGRTTTDDYGNVVDWARQAYNYGLDVNNKQDFAKLHYQVVGSRTPEKDANGNIVRDESGNIVPRPLDAAPDVYAPQIARTYIANVLTPYLIDKSNKIGTVFGEFVKPSDYVDEILKAVNLDQNKDQWSTILKNYGIDPNSSLSEIKNELVSSLAQDSTTDIKTKISDFIKEGTQKAPTQLDIGVEYIQREKPPTAEGEAPTGVYAVFKNAGFTGTEKEFYDKFMPDASQEDINLMNAAFTPKGKAAPLLPTITGTGIQKISSMADLFGDADIQEVLGTAGVAPTTKAKPSLFAQLMKPGEEPTAPSDPFAQEDTTYGVTGPTKSQSQFGIGNPFDTVGITDPFSDSNDPFTTSSSFFNTTKTSVISPKIGSSMSFLGSSSKNSGFTSSLFDSFGGGFGF